MHKLPRLNAIRAFETAGRHLSFSKAAGELNVSAAAVSQQIRNLEEFIGVPLFRRLTRAVILTDAGQEAMPLLSDGFDRLAAGIEKIRAHESGGTLTVSAAPSFAAKWLVQRLPRFQAQFPDIQVRLDPSLNLVDFARENVDIAIRFGDSNHQGLCSDLLIEEHTIAVCSPDLLRGPHPLKTPYDLRHHNLLHCDWGYRDRVQPDWTMWLRLAGVDDINATRGPIFTADALAVEAAIDGQGVALTNRTIVAGDIARGRLVSPFLLSLSSDFGFYLVCPESTAELAKNTAFREWILSEMGVAS